MYSSKICLSWRKASHLGGKVCPNADTVRVPKIIFHCVCSHEMILVVSCNKRYFSRRSSPSEQFEAGSFSNCNYPRVVFANRIQLARYIRNALRLLILSQKRFWVYLSVLVFSICLYVFVRVCRLMFCMLMFVVNG